ncbi:MAG: APC family permease [Anaerovoracaceae bacterium]
MNKRYGIVTATCMVVGIVIGSGVFFKAQTVLQITDGDMPMGILAWIVGGLIMLSCILAFAVMATMYEKVNGVVDYAEATVGKRYAYLVGWFMSVIYYPSLVAVLAWLSARYTLVFFQSVNPELVFSEGGLATGAECMALSLVFLCGSYGLNALSPKLAGHFQVSTTLIKLVPLVLMMIFGVIYGLKTGQLAENFSGAAPGIIGTAGPASGTGMLLGAVVSTAFAYEGWIVATSINAELKDARRTLPAALILGSLIIIAVYVFYFIGVAGGASTRQLMEEGATTAFLQIFGNVFGNILNLFVAVSCMGTLNGLMLGNTRGLYALAVRGEGPKPEVFGRVDETTKMAGNSSIFGLLLAAFWFLHFYGSNLAPFPWFGKFSFDSSELPIVTTYLLYLPIFVLFMKKNPQLGMVKRFVVPSLAICGSIFMVCAAIYAHGVKPYLAAKAAGEFSMPVLFYLILFLIIAVIGVLLNEDRRQKK